MYILAKRWDEDHDVEQSCFRRQGDKTKHLPLDASGVARLLQNFDIHCHRQNHNVKYVQ